MANLTASVRFIRSFEQHVNSYLLSPEQFMQLHPGFSREQIARIAGCSINTAKRWFYKTENRIEPTQLHRLRLGMAHQFLSLEGSRDVTNN